MLHKKSKESKLETKFICGVIGKRDETMGKQMKLGAGLGCETGTRITAEA